jgi:hypothetical protein
MTDEFDEEAKAVQEASKALIKVTEAAEKFGAFIAKYTHEPIEAGVGIFSDKLKYLRWERQLRLIKRAESFLQDLGYTDVKHPMPLKYAVPLLEAASLEEDDNLQDMYASLLVNACVENGAPPFMRSYIDTIERFTPLMASIFHNFYKNYSAQSEKFMESLDPERTLPEDRTSALIVGDYSEETELAWNEIDRLGCLRVKRQMSSSKLSLSSKPTRYGLALFSACNIKEDRQ